MNRMWLCLWLVFALSTRALCQTELYPVWDNGLKFKSRDGGTSIGIGGRLHYDASFIRQSKALDSVAGRPLDKVEVRRARLSFEGTINKTVEYEFEFTLAKRVRYADLYVAFLKLPFVEKLTVGHFREPFGLEENTSSNSIVFMERSLTSSFAPGRNTGIMVQKCFLDKKLRLYAGVFRITNSLGADGDSSGKHSIAGRLAYYKSWDTAQRKVLHLGISTHAFAPEKSTYSLKAENETYTDATYLRTGKIRDVKNVRSIGGEAGYSVKKLTLQSEYVYTLVQKRKDAIVAPVRASRNFNAFYATASYFIGGERGYSHGNNRFSKISFEPNRKQVWELALRYSRVFLKESVQELKRMNDITVGLNWYYNENSRLMFNYIYSRIQSRYSVNALQMRLQVTF